MKASIAILFVMAASRFIPHPPNFTSVIALSFYVPAILGRKYIPVLLISFVFTDMIIGLHKTTLFTWSSILLIGYIANYFKASYRNRIFGSIIGAVIFFITSNFGVWLTGNYGYHFNGLINCYILAIPFFYFTLLSTIIYSIIIETIIKLIKNYRNFKRDISFL